MLRQRFSYGIVLESLGAWLDETDPARFTLFEVNDGFTVILTSNRAGRPEISEVHFDNESLAQKRRRSILGTFSTGRVKRWSMNIAGREAFLAALGFELDFHDANSVLLDELDEKLLLTYNYLDATKGYGWHKHIVYLGPLEVSSIVEVADKRNREHKKAERIFRW